MEYELALATEQRKEQWYAIFLGVNGTRTLASLWTYLTQQFIGLTVFYTFGTYFFQQAGLSNPFRITAITSSINIATMVVMIFLADLTVGECLHVVGAHSVGLQLLLLAFLVLFLRSKQLTISWFSSLASGISGKAVLLPSISKLK